MPDLQFYVGRGLDQPDRFVTLTVSHVAPEARAARSVCVRADPLAAPVIRANYLQDPEDVDALVRGVKLARKLAGLVGLRRPARRRRSIPDPG